MKPIPLLLLDPANAEGQALDPLLRALGVAGVRWGRLCWQPDGTPPASAEAAGLDPRCAKRVEIFRGRSLAIKPLAGPPVFRDVLREHFVGHGVVLIEGEPPAGVSVPRIRSLGDGRYAVLARVDGEEGAREEAGGEERAVERAFEAEEIVVELRKARPFGWPRFGR